MKTLDKIILALACLTALVLGVIFLPKINPDLSSSIGSGAATFFSDIWTGIKIVFGLLLALGVTFVIIKFKQMNRTQIIYDPADGRPVRAVVHKGQLVQLSTNGMDADQAAQQIAQMKQLWAMLGTASTSMRNMSRFMDELEIVDADDDPASSELDQPADVKLLEGPRQPDIVYKLIDQLRSQATMIDEEESIVGYVDGKTLRGRLFGEDNNMFDSVFVAGDQGFGKSVFAVYMHVLNILHGGRTLIIDPDAELGQSLAKRLGPLANELFLLCPVANTPDDALRLLDIAEDELEYPSEAPVLFLIDEFTMIMRSVASKGKWAEVGKRLSTIAEDWATRGRKRRRRAVVFGQMTKATRAGGTELRDSMTTVCFHLKKRRAQMVLEAEEAAIVPTLKTGEVLLIPARAPENSYLLQLPFPDAEALDLIARAMIQSGRFNQASDVSTTVRTDELSGNAEMVISTSGNAVETASQGTSKIIDGVFPDPAPITENSPTSAVSKEIREMIRRLAAMNVAHGKIAKAVGLSGRNYGLYRQVCQEEGIPIPQQQAGEA